MKKYLIPVLGVILFACTQQKGFKIEVNLEGADGQMVLEQRMSGEWVLIDSATVVDGKAILEGELELPGIYYVSLAGQRAKALIFVENSNIKMTGKADSINFAEISGSKTHDEYKNVENEIRKISEEYMAIYQESRAASAAGDTAKAQMLMNKVEELYNNTNTVQENFVKNNPASYVTPYFLSRIQYDKSMEELDSMLNALDPKLDQVQTVIDLKGMVEKMKKVAVGQIAPDFVQNDPDGNPVKFSDIYSNHELTLLDFWASWCGPCRRENPNVVTVYNEFKDAGFTVFGVSLDREKEAWLKGISDDNLTWTHVSDLEYWNNSAAKLYAVSSIPQNLLVNKKGEIVAKNKREAELRKAVAEILGKE